MCGEHASTIPLNQSRLGSSPRVWGALTKGEAEQTLKRLIPTCVGSTPQAAESHRQYPAHPHVCGEHLMRENPGEWEFGSSPRVWGAPGTEAAYGITERLIPTCVGSTTFSSVLCLSGTAHPHVCGEHCEAQENGGHGFGSSPRVWGARSRSFRTASTSRLIPTCVGSTSAGQMHSWAQKAHPHVCGEHLGRLPRVRRLTGSSPRVWGAH